MTTISLVTFIHDPEADWCPCDTCAVARDVVEGMAGIVLDDQPGTFMLEDHPVE